MQQWVTHLFEQYPVLVYGVIILVSFVEGPILAMFCGVLVKLGNAPFIPVYLALMAGDLIGDTFWYWVGHQFGHRFVRRFGRYFSIHEANVNSVEKIFHKYHSRILIISKITMGLGFALVTLITAGMVKIPFKKYFALNFIGQFVWTGFLLFIGYMFGNLYLSVNGFLGKMSLFALFVVAFFALMGYGKFIKNKMSRSAELA